MQYVNITKIYLLFLAVARRRIPDCLFLLEALQEPQEQNYPGQRLHHRYFPPVSQQHTDQIGSIYN